MGIRAAFTVGAIAAKPLGRVSGGRRQPEVKLCATSNLFGITLAIDYMSFLLKKVRFRPYSFKFHSSVKGVGL